VPGIQQVHQLTILNLLRVIRLLDSQSMISGLRANLHRHHLHDNGLKMPGKQTCVCITPHIQMTQTGTDRHW